jgi:hypothetical protein
MHHHHGGPAWLAILNLAANLGIVGGYLIVPFTILARLPLTTFVRVAGVFFFVCCAATHLYMAFDMTPPWWMALNHIVQAIAVWCFVIGFAVLVRKASTRRAGEQRTAVGGPGVTQVPQ